MFLRTVFVPSYMQLHNVVGARVDNVEGVNCYTGSGLGGWG